MGCMAQHIYYPEVHLICTHTILYLFSCNEDSHQVLHMFTSHTPLEIALSTDHLPYMVTLDLQHHMGHAS